MSIVFFIKEIAPRSLSKIDQASAIVHQGKVTIRVLADEPIEHNCKIQSH